MQSACVPGYSPVMFHLADTNCLRSEARRRHVFLGRCTAGRCAVPTPFASVECLAQKRPADPHVRCICREKRAIPRSLAHSSRQAQGAAHFTRQFQRGRTQNALSRAFFSTDAKRLRAGSLVRHVSLGRYELPAFGGAPSPRFSRQMRGWSLHCADVLCICRVFCAEMSPEVSCSLHLPRETCNPLGARASFSTGADRETWQAANGAGRSGGQRAAGECEPAAPRPVPPSPRPVESARSILRGQRMRV